MTTKTFMSLLLLAIAGTADAGSMRCGESVVGRGLTFFEVHERCGQPDLQYAFDSTYVPGVVARVTEWVYEQGSNRFRRVLTFEEGRLRRIELRPKPLVPLRRSN